MHAVIKKSHTHDFGAGPVLHADCISDALRKGLARGAAARAADAADGAASPNDLEANVRSLLDGCPFTVRDLSGDRTGMRGREDLAGSLAITFLGMQTRVKEAAASAPAATAGIAASRPLDVDLPERVVDVVAQDAGLSAPFSASFYKFAQDLKAEVLARVPNSALAAGGEALAAQTLREFKNFHRGLCERFGYTHDARDWKRDQVSLEEHIAKLTAGAAV
jgi:hypothetical protein